MLTVAIPALASGSGRAAGPSDADPAFVCVTKTPGSAGVQSTTPLAASSKHSEPRHRHHRRHAKHHGKAAQVRKTTLCTSPCPGPAAGACTPRSCAVEDSGTGVPSGATVTCPPPVPCVASSAGGPNPTGTTMTCGPIGCPGTYVVTSDGPSGPTGATGACEPLPCADGATASTVQTGAGPQCIPGHCPLTAIAGTGAQRALSGSAAGTPASCPPLPTCPLPQPGAPVANPAIYACVEISSGAASSG